MSSSKKSKTERLRSAAIVKLKYLMLSGTMDSGFKTVYRGVLSDLDLTEEEVERYIDEHIAELKKTCLSGN